MKTPRELLLENHRQAQPKLDAIRRDSLAGLKELEPATASFSLREILRSLRWHLAGMGAVWAFVLALHLGTDRPSQMIASAAAPVYPPQITMASLRENRRQLAEMIGSVQPKNQSRELLLPKPRSELCGNTSFA